MTRRSRDRRAISATALAAPAIPAGDILPLNAQVPSLITLSGVQVTDTQNVDTWNGLTQATAADQPTYDLYNVAGGPAVIFGGSSRPDELIQNIFLTGSVSSSIPFTRVLFGRFDNLLGDTPVMELGNTGAGNGFLLRTGGSPLIKIVGPGGTLTANGSWNLCDRLPHDLIVMYDGTSLTVLFDAVPLSLTVTGSAGTGSIAGTLTFGNDHAQSSSTPLQGAIAFYDEWNRILTPSEIAGLRAYLRYWWYRPAYGGPAQYNVIAIGDSIQHGDQATTLASAPQYSAANCLVSLLSPRLGTISNDSVGGSRFTLATGGSTPVIHDQWTGTGVNQTVSGIPNLVFVEGGVNDIAVLSPTDGPSAIADAVLVEGYRDTVLNQVESDLTSVLNGGIKKHLLTIETISFRIFGGTFDQCRGLVNTNTIANYTSAGNASVAIRIVPSGADLGFGFSNSPPYATQSPHLSQAGHQRRMGLYLRVLGDNNYIEKQATTFTITPQGRLVAVGNTLQLASNATYTNANNANLASTAVWSTSNASVATVSAGLVTGVAPGAVTITAVDPASGFQAQTTMTVITLDTPLTISGVYAYYRSDHGVHVATGVSLWQDAVQGLDVSQSNTSKQPPYSSNGGVNNLPFINWGSSSQFLKSSAFVGNVPFEVFIVVDTTNGVIGGYTIDYGAGNANGAVQYSGGPTFNVIGTGAGTAIISAGIHILDVAQNTPGNGTIAVDGGTANAGTAAGTNVTNLFLGNSGFGTTGWSSPMYEVVIYSNILGSTDRATLISYFKARYSIP